MRPSVGFLTPRFWMTTCRSCLIALVLTLCIVDSNAGAGARRVPEPAVDRLLSDKSVAVARTAIRAMEAGTIDTQIAVCEVPAPPFGEAGRARVMKGLFE